MQKHLNCWKEREQMSDMEGKYLRVRADIDLAALRHNMDTLHAMTAEGVLMTDVIKANGYGHGAVRIAQMTEDLPYLWGHAVATYEEAKDLRDAGIRKPILILGYTFPYSYAEMAALEIRPAVFREDTLQELEDAAGAAGKKIRIHIAVDTGMSRIGVTPDETGVAFVKKALSFPHIEVEGAFTHFARADEEDFAPASAQFDAFTGFLRKVEEEAGYRIPIRHCSNSAGILVSKEVGLDMVRAGIVIYGLHPSAETASLCSDLKPVMSLKSHVTFVKTIPAGTPVSYGGIFTAGRDTRVATVPVGYADGYPRLLTGKVSVLIRGRRVPVIGRICMDQFMADVTDLPEVRPGDEVTLIGRDGGETITMEELGGLCGRFNYELACDISERVPRRYIEG